MITGGKLKPYQIEVCGPTSLNAAMLCPRQGLNWLIRLYESGINGILADEMVCTQGQSRVEMPWVWRVAWSAFTAGPRQDPADDQSAGMAAGGTEHHGWVL